jgi:hypothetical protein
MKVFYTINRKIARKIVKNNCESAMKKGRLFMESALRSDGLSKDVPMIFSISALMASQKVQFLCCASSLVFAT